MPTPLTLAQTIAIANGSWVAPLHANSLLKRYETTGKPLSLLSVRDKLQSRNNIVILQLRNDSILEGYSGLTALQTRWNSLDTTYVPTQAGLVSFVKFLQQYGISVVKISTDWRTVALKGTTQAFASLPTAFFSVPENPVTKKAEQFEPHGQGDGQAAVGGGVAAGGATAAGAGSWVMWGGGTVTWGGTATTTGALGGTGLGTSGVAGGAAEAALAGSGPPGWIILAIGVVALGVGAYLFSTSSSTTGTSTGTSGSTGPTSQNDDGNTGSYQAGDGTEVYGASSDSDATAIANALNGQSAVDPGTIPSAPSAAPICPTNICPTVPIDPVAVAEGGGGSDNPTGGPVICIVGAGAGTTTTCPPSSGSPTTCLGGFG